METISHCTLSDYNKTPQLFGWHLEKYPTLYSANFGFHGRPPPCSELMEVKLVGQR